MSVLVQKNDPDEMKIAREASFLCELFQEHKFDVDEKKMIIKDLIREHKKKLEEQKKLAEAKNGQGN